MPENQQYKAVCRNCRKIGIPGVDFIPRPCYAPNDPGFACVCNDCRARKRARPPKPDRAAQHRLSVAALDGAFRKIREWQTYAPAKRLPEIADLATLFGIELEPEDVLL